MSLFTKIFGHKVNRTRVYPVTLKITIIFTLIILVSNLTSNYINLILNRTELNHLMRQLLIKDLQEMNTFCNNQRDIYEFNQDERASFESIEKKASFELKSNLFMGIKPDGSIVFQSAPDGRFRASFTDKVSLEKMKGENQEGYLSVDLDNAEYLAVYKYNKKWDVYLLLSVSKDAFYSEQTKIFLKVSLIILFITLASAWVGIYLLRNILRYISVITSNIKTMIESQRLEKIDLTGATNDDITYMGMAFNSLSGTVDNLIGIFRKFTNKDIVVKAYRDREVKLTGERQDLTILFSDIKSFTNITETLGMDIIKLLNMHYDRAIRRIQDHDGIISAIIGDALLAIFGVMDESVEKYDNLNKSYQALEASYEVYDVARLLRLEMTQKKDELVRMNGKLTPEERKVYRACLLEIGVGIDGGDVFYGTIGSHVRMTNTVIGDKVNSSSRLEGLTRIYRVPVICSEYVKEDIKKHILNNGYHFLELDTVQVKGKTTGMRVYFPIPQAHFTERLKKEIEKYSLGLELYYRGDWIRALEYFQGLRFKPSRVFRERIRNSAPPQDWNGIWEMKTK